ncbi:MAG: hypothetical protein LBE22_00595 [Azoarcus sp.]|jgi:hypothetical protein|nr:hypothetical protein [Azoarcus sp.]
MSDEKCSPPPAGPCFDDDVTSGEPLPPPTHIRTKSLREMLGLPPGAPAEEVDAALMGDGGED